MKIVACNLKAKMSAAKTRADLRRILALLPTIVGLCEIGGTARALILKVGFARAGMSMWAAIPTPIAWPKTWTVIAKGKTHLSDRTDVGKPGAGPEILRAKDAPWVLLHEPIGRLHFVINAHLAPQPGLNDKRGALHAQQVDALAAKIAAVKAENPGVICHLLGDLNTPDRDRLTPITDLGLDMGDVTNDLHGHQLTYIASDLKGSRGMVRGLHTDHNAVTAALKQQGEPVPTPKGFMPGAIVKNIPPGSNDPGIKPVGGVYHVAVSESDSLHDFFAHRSGGIESHFYVRRDGSIEQYRSIYFEADANFHGNSFMRNGVRCGLLSIETQGMGPGEWTKAQIAALKAITTWANTEAGVKIDVIDKWDGDGWGYHTMWGSPSHWTPSSKTCPGPDRIKQYDTILAPWLKAGGNDPAPKPTLVQQTRALLTTALARAEAKGNSARAAMIRAALAALPGK